MRTLVCFLAGVLAAPCIALAQVVQPPQSPPAGVVRDNPTTKTATARLSGRVVAADNGKPLRRAVVRVSAPDYRGLDRSVSTGADGRWEFRDLPAGRYRVGVAKAGYVALAYGQLRPFQPPKVIELGAGQVLDRLDVSLPRASVITGSVVDEFGEPVASVVVSANRYRYISGVRQLLNVAVRDAMDGLGPMRGLETGASALTDDLGQYRLHGLSPGDYYVSALADPRLQVADRTSYAPTFYPGTASIAEAQRVALGQGQEAQNISFSLAAIRVSNISGTAVSSTGSPIAAGMVSLVTIPTNGAYLPGGQMKPDGSFTITGVPPGEYRLYLQHNLRAPNVPEVASMPITVTGQDITGIALVTAPTATATGRIVFDGGAPPDAPMGPGQRLAIVVSPAIGSLEVSSFARLRDDRTFEASGLWDKRIFRVANAPPGWSLKSIVHDGSDVTDSGIDFKPGQTVSGIEIAMTRRATELSGIVQDARGRSVTDYTVVAFAPDSAKWGYLTRHVRSGQPDENGRFAIRELPPGDYLVIALEYLESGDELDPEQLEKWKASATRLTLSEGEKKPVELKLIR